MQVNEVSFLDSQVSGSVPFFSSPCGRLVWKPATPREVEFFEKLLPAQLQAHVPKYFGRETINMREWKGPGLSNTPLETEREKSFVSEIYEKFDKRKLKVS